MLGLWCDGAVVDLDSPAQPLQQEVVTVEVGGRSSVVGVMMTKMVAVMKKYTLREVKIRFVDAKNSALK